MSKTELMRIVEIAYTDGDEGLKGLSPAVCNVAAFEFQQLSLRLLRAGIEKSNAN